MMHSKLRAARVPLGKAPESARHAATMAVVVAALSVAGVLLNPGFLSGANIGNILAIAAVLAMATAGETVVMASGAGVDISVGAMMSFGAIIAVEMQNQRDSMLIPSLAVVLAAGGLVGLANGLGVIKAKVPALVFTFATANIVQTLQLIVTKGSPHGKPAPAASAIGTGRLLPWLPWLALVAAAVGVLVHLVLTRTAFGRRVFAAGANEGAAALAGFRVDRIRIASFAISGAFSALAGFWFAAFNTFMKVGAANYLNLPALAAVLIGGMPFSGGKGSYPGSMAGALALTLVTSLLIMMRTTEPVKLIVNGAIILCLLALYNREPAARQ